jgi:predicted amidohydrolase YtcJ
MRVLIAVMALATCALAQNGKQVADVVFVNGHAVVPMNLVYGCANCAEAGIDSRGFRPVMGPFEALAIKAGKIVLTDSNSRVRQLIGPNTQVIDLHGKYIAAGFNDAHTHIEEAGLEKLNVNLLGTTSLEDMLGRVAAAAKKAAPGEWLTGGGWDHTKWTKQVLPSKEDLDKVTGDHPSVFSRVDGHIAVSNSLALKAGDVTAQSQTPQGGKIDIGPDGQPTGILRETARDLVESHIPAPTPAKLKEAIQLALADAAEHGLTSVQDNSSWDAFLTYEQLEQEGKLTVRISEWLPFDASVGELQEHRAHHPGSDPWLHTAMLKGFMDGSLGSHTAALLRPYSDEPNNSGIPRYTQDQLTKMTVERALAGFQIGFHAIGDKGVEMALNAFEEAERAVREKNVKGPGGTSDPKGFRFRIEHAQVTTPEQINRFAKLHVIASMQPNHLLTDMNWAEARLGPERAKTSYAWKAMLENHVDLAFGTDYPVEPITPFRGIYAAVTRTNEEGTKSYFPKDKLTIQQALMAYTMGSAYAQFAEKQKGMLVPGMLADFVVLDRDISQVPPAEILKTKVLRTVVGGKTVYEAR